MKMNDKELKEIRYLEGFKRLLCNDRTGLNFLPKMPEEFIEKLMDKYDWDFYLFYKLFRIKNTHDFK